MTLQDWLAMAAVVVIAVRALVFVRRGERFEASVCIVGFTLTVLSLLALCVELESQVARERFWVRHLWADRDSAYRENQALRETLRGRTAR